MRTMTTRAAARRSIVALPRYTHRGWRAARRLASTAARADAFWSRALAQPRCHPARLSSTPRTPALSLFAPGAYGWCTLPSRERMVRYIASYTLPATYFAGIISGRLELRHNAAVYRPHAARNTARNLAALAALQHGAVTRWLFRGPSLSPAWARFIAPTPLLLVSPSCGDIHLVLRLLLPSLNDELNSARGGCFLPTHYYTGFTAPIRVTAGREEDNGRRAADIARGITGATSLLGGLAACNASSMPPPPLQLFVRSSISAYICWLWATAAYRAWATL